MFTGNEAKGETKKRAGDREPRREQPLSRRSGENGITGWQEQKKRERGKEGKKEEGKGGMGSIRRRVSRFAIQVRMESVDGRPVDGQW